MKVVDATKILLEASGLNGEQAKDFAIKCFANLFVNLSEQYGDGLQRELLNAAITRTRQIYSAERGR